MLTVVNALWSYVYWYLRPILKWFLRKTTKLCELQRICYGEKYGFSRADSVEISLSRSRTPDIKQMVLQLNNLATQGRFSENTRINCVEYAVKLVVDVKNINPIIHKQFLSSFRVCLFKIYGYKQLLHEVEVLRKTHYSSEHNVHEAKLLRLWNLLKPNEPLQNRISKQWSQIGFQGDDPKTDFRGMGLLGLENLLYFASEYTTAARHVLSHSCHPEYGYSFAIVGINLTSMAYHLLKKETLKVHFYNTVKDFPSMHHFHHVYSYLFYEFDKFWLSEKPRDIMEFNRIRDKFEKSLLKRLEDTNAALKLNFTVETL